MFKFKTLSSILLIFMFTIGTSLAQLSPAEQPVVDVSDNKLKKVASAIVEIQSLEQETQQQMIQTITDDGFTIERFNELQQAQFNPDQESDATDDEMENFSKTIGKLEQIQQTAQEGMQKAIEDEGLTFMEYQEVIGAIQNDPELQKRIQELIQNAD